MYHHQFNKQYLVEVSHRQFNKILAPIKHLLKCQTEHINFSRDGYDGWDFASFYHPQWEEMLVADIKEFHDYYTKEHWKKYYINESFAAILKGMVNDAETRS